MEKTIEVEVLQQNFAYVGEAETMDSRYTPDNEIRPIEDLISTTVGYQPQKKREERGPAFDTKRYKNPAAQQQKSFLGDNQVHQKSKTLNRSRDHLANKDHLAYRETKRKSSLAPLLWGSIGFVIGISFWHFIGFWSLVDKAIFQDPERQTLSRLLEQKPLLEKSQKSQENLPKQVQAVQAHNDHIACVALVIDRKRNETFSQPCRPGIKLTHSTSEVRTAARAN